MDQVSPAELMAQLRHEVWLLAAQPSDQLQWLDAENYPMDELWEQYFDSVPGWLPRLREAGLVPAAREAALLGLERILRAFIDSTDEDLFTNEGLLAHTRWDQLRASARTVLTQIADKPD